MRSPSPPAMGRWLLTVAMAVVTMAAAAAAAAAMPSSLNRDFPYSSLPNSASPGTQTQGHAIKTLLQDDILVNLLTQQGQGESYTKLERMLVNTLLNFRDRLARPQPDLGLPAFDPFVFTDGKEFDINTPFAAMNATLKSVISKGISHFKVDQLSLYLVERIGVLDITIPGFSFELVVDLPTGSWVSPLKIPLDDQIKLRFYSSSIKIYTRGQISVKNARLSMESTKLDVDLGDYTLALLSLRPGTLSANPGLNEVLAGVVKRLTPLLIKEWTPVVERYLAQRLDEKLQELQLSDLINN